MVKKEIIPHLKSSCLALGLTRKNDAQPFTIQGSGFFIDEEGFFVTVSVRAHRTGVYHAAICSGNRVGTEARIAEIIQADR